jgi:hypothetical protein
MDRARWEEFERAYYDGQLPASLVPIWQLRKDENLDITGCAVLKSYEDALRILRFSGDKCEIIAFWSPELAEIKGAIRSEIELKYLGLDCLGFDEAGFAEWSVLLAGPYAQPDRFASTIRRLNDSGLLTTGDDCDDLFRQYVALSAAEVVEPLADRSTPMHVKIFSPI